MGAGLAPRPDAEKLVVRSYHVSPHPSHLRYLCSFILDEPSLSHFLSPDTELSSFIYLQDISITSQGWLSSLAGFLGTCFLLYLAGQCL